MNNMPIDNVEIIVALILFVFVVLYMIWRGRRKKRVLEESENFKEKLLSELKGLYPVPRYIDKDEFDRFRASIPIIKEAAEKYRKFIPGSGKKSFDSALDEYFKHCRETTWEDCVAFKIIPGERKPEDEGPKEIFRQRVNALLSFTKK